MPLGSVTPWLTWRLRKLACGATPLPPTVPQPPRPSHGSLPQTARPCLHVCAAVACVNRHWRVVCRDLEADALAAAPASTAAASALAARAAAAAAAALGAAAVGGPRQAVTSATADDSVGGVGGANGALPDGAGGAAVGEGGADESPAGGGGGEEGGGEGGMVGLWGCMNLRSRPGVKFSDAVMRRGLASGRWRQVRACDVRRARPALLAHAHAQCRTFP